MVYIYKYNRYNNNNITIFFQDASYLYVYRTRWSFLHWKGTWRAFNQTPIHYLLHGTPFCRCPWDLNPLDTLLLNHLLWYTHVSLWGVGNDKKKIIKTVICWRVITLHSSGHLKVTLVHWEGLLEPRDADAKLPCVKATLVIWWTKNNKPPFIASLGGL